MCIFIIFKNLYDDISEVVKEEQAEEEDCEEEEEEK